MKSRATKRRINRRISQKVVVSVMAVALLSLGLGGALFFSQNYLNPQNFNDYAVQGFDVSRHQGEIQWQKIDPKKYQFVFIKATEGGDYQDPKFQENWLNARQQGLAVGAYHFFRNCKTGEEQAKNYIQAVPKKSDSLPPVMDLEFQWTCPEVNAEQLQQRIRSMADKLEQHYGKKPIFYTTPNYYKTYIEGQFEGYTLWLQDLKDVPPRIDQRPWMFWQYSHTGKINGINTDVDLNVFRGNIADFQLLLEPKNSTQ
ncbi:MAG: glycoside hydrolase family 25 protein [Acinetobacter populi]|jgi:lysozyme|uniref:glycoside hydrolase family 25 protein n=1 Tax=Acinetobacter populi TaxID=1582270 RepID=UPI0023549D0F|nr:GH25 family lysozyme [Acinetobacter populi]MCH4246694.1 glycoside hydrolase family 25 protein [Acinetobacter populi]